jgi:predicted  nucleic acid-binding Zn-ribbon protein
MAQTEALMLVGLGFVLALLLVMAFGRGVWSLSNSFAKRQRENDLPATMLSLQADRDRLRAEHAAMTSRLEAINESAKAAITSQTAEVARHRNRVVGLTEDINEKSTELSAKNDVVTNLNTQLQELTEILDLQQRAARDLTVDNAEKEVAIKQLEDVIENLKAEIVDSKRDVDRVTGQLEAAMVEASALKQEMAQAVAMNSRHARTAAFDSSAEHMDFDSQIPSPRRVDVLSEVMSPFEEPATHNTTVQVQASAPVLPDTTRPDTARHGRYNFDKPSTIHFKRNPPPPVQQPDIKAVLKEARRDLIERGTSNASEETGLGTKRPAEGVISLAKRLRALQAKSDEKLTKTLK